MSAVNREPAKGISSVQSREFSVHFCSQLLAPGRLSSAVGSGGVGRGSVQPRLTL